MTTACFFRYAWIAPAAFEELLVPPDSSERPDLADADQALAFLQRLARTDFPVLLLWSHPVLGRRLFDCGSDGEVGVARRVAASAKASRKAALVALRYALGAFGRFGPRDAWVGSAFAVANGGDAPARVQRSDEALCVEPDIAWFARRAFPQAPGGIVPGDDAWSYLLRKSRHDPLMTSLVEGLREQTRALQGAVWRYAAVASFQVRTDARIAAAGLADAQGAPHRWGVSRFVRRELAIRSDVLAQCDGLYQAARRRAMRHGALACDPASGGVPFPRRVLAVEPERLLCPAEEMDDWLLHAGKCKSGDAPFLPDHPPPQAATVVRIEGTRARYRFHEPNPKRTANTVARHLAAAPAYLDADRQAVSIAPPDGLTDPRLLRCRQEEAGVDRIPVGIDAMFRLPFAGIGCDEQSAREMRSPRYAAAADLLPTWFDAGRASVIGFGRIDAETRVWLLMANEARALAGGHKTAACAAAFYAARVHAPLGSPRWVDVLVDGKASRLPTFSLLGFLWLIHVCRIAESPIVVRADFFEETGPFVCDDEGRPLACELYAVRTDAEAACAATA